MKPTIKHLTCAVLPLLMAATTLAADRPPNLIVFYTDDHGYADLGAQGVVDDIKTPNVDNLAAGGVRATQGYTTAPQCVPSRAGLLSGRFQSKFGLEVNTNDARVFHDQTTIAERLSKAGYATAMFGKWHLGSVQGILQDGFKHVFPMHGGNRVTSNIDLKGQDRPLSELNVGEYHIIANSKAACATIERYRDQPFFLYVAYRAPHVPLDAPKNYLKRFPGPMPERRRQALAMLSAVDDGVGMVLDTLGKNKLLENTLIFYIGDNGAPLKIHKADTPGGGPGWDGSLNDPLNGEKGMLTEGGIRVPFVVSWPGTIPAGQVCGYPLSTLDVAATAAALAGLTVPAGELDGIDLIPYLTGRTKTAPDRKLHWRWAEQAAILDGDWKFLMALDRKYLFNLKDDKEERHNMIESHPEIAKQLKSDLENWTGALLPPGLPARTRKNGSERFYDHYLDGKTVAPTEPPAEPAEPGKGKRAKRAKRGE